MNWPFKNKIQQMIDNTIEYAMIRRGLRDADLQVEFAKMNEQILVAYGKSSESTNLNSQSIIALSEALAATIKAVNTLDDRLTTLESQLSITKVTFIKGGD
jgi:hypothetical protein